LLFHHGIRRPRALLTREGRAALERLELSPSAHQALTVALTMIDACDAQIAPLDRELGRYARHQAGCVALMKMFGVGPLTSAAILAELGDARRFSSSRHAVRFAGLDITVYSSDARRSPGRLSRQASTVLRSAVYEAAQTAARPGSPDHAYYLTLGARLGKSRANSRSRASCCGAPTTSCVSSRRRACARHVTKSNARTASTHTDDVRPTPAKLLPTRPFAAGGP